VTALFTIAIGLVVAGVAVNGFWRADPATWRLTGVLQRAGVTLAIGATADTAATGDDRRRIALLGSIAGFLTLAHMLVMAHVPPPGGVAGDLSPAGNLAAWVDRAVLGAHAWSGRWDPDGILSTTASTSTVLVGMAAGIIVTSRWHGARTMVPLVGASAGVMILGIVATAMVPVNRSLWSASFVLLSAGVATIGLAALVWIERR
jgi:predicted acyltransferase